MVKYYLELFGNIWKYNIWNYLEIYYLEISGNMLFGIIRKYLEIYHLMLPAVPCWENSPNVEQKSFDKSIVAGCGLLLFGNQQ